MVLVVFCCITLTLTFGYQPEPSSVAESKSLKLPANKGDGKTEVSYCKAGVVAQSEAAERS